MLLREKEKKTVTPFELSTHVVGASVFIFPEIRCLPSIAFSCISVAACDRSMNYARAVMAEWITACSGFTARWEAHTAVCTVGSWDAAYLRDSQQRGGTAEVQVALVELRDPDDTFRLHQAASLLRCGLFLTQSVNFARSNSIDRNYAQFIVM